ncbi:MAG: SDR family NAD(P)-dependent oxidoreductase [Saprospiraceae bacterium]|jgi:NADP-dependent 3-hydroxy acid dehydrogenase YdfG|nr:SDR family NAD(P)-dependent oxidoreductase [Saprospiraceae bacterium]
MSTIHLVYAPENIDLAEQITRDIGRIGIPFRHITVRADEPPGQLSATAEAADGPVLWLLTDNFLKNHACMAGVLDMFRVLNGRNNLLTVVADGRKLLEDGRTFEQVPTRFDRVVHAIQYMNHWQTIYLDRTERLSDVPPEQREQYDRDLEVLRRIANEIGELFSALRDAGYISLPELQADDYARFFSHFHLNDWHSQYRRLAALDHEAPPPPPVAIEHPTPVAQAPVFAGPLVPQYTEPETDLPHPEATGSSLLEHLIEPEQTPAAEPEPISVQTAEAHPENTPETSEQEIRQTINDAWFWLERGHHERGFELFRVAIEQHPRHEALLAEYQRALDQYGQNQNGAPEPTPDPEHTLHQEPSTSQPINQPTSQPANQSTSQPINQSTSQPINQPTSQPINQSTSQPINQPTSQPINQPTSQPVNQPAEADSYFAMGENALAKGDYLLAKYCWDRVTDLNPQYPGIYRRLAELTCDFLTDYRETAAYYLDEAIAAEPEAADLHYRLAMLLRDHLDQPAKARQHLGDVVVLDPGHAGAWLALARFSLEAGDAKQAESLYRHAVSLDASLQTADDDALFHNRQEQPAEVPQPEPELPQPESTPEPSNQPTNQPVNQSTNQPINQPTNQPVNQSTGQPLTVLITGATSGIGRATAEIFARNGHRLILVGRRAERLDALRRHFADDYRNDAVLTVPFDVRDAAAVADHLENLPEAWQDIDVLLNNAGLAKGLAPIHEGSLEHWNTMIDTNIKGLLYVTRAVAPGMVRRRRGHIINIGSSAGKEVYPNGNVYCATKFAVEALTRGMRMDLYTHGIRVSQVSPGHVEETEFALTRFDGDAERAQIYKDFQPLKASDVAEAIYFAVTRPPHVNVQDIWLFPAQQAASTMIDRSGR